ncbi:hypothetical protein M378DRAFT_850887 [Amanita muscaria Koide BX008]|uniref:Uncharacterized protein n=1 Tax=Amanita muscaria (strain Koide BX008) TaxID=946122 RepID=A0A0C2SEX4_AMAMK|nr:hypothetical protein M378DRAFT_850887 [Amanita muscaria Koide BX008]
MSSKSSISRSLFMLLFLLCTSVLSVSAVGLAKHVLKSLNIASFIGTQRYTQPVTHQLMVKEAKAALDSLTGGKKTKPAVVSALWTGGNEIIFASSAKGPGTVDDKADDHIPTPVQDALKKCAADFAAGHNYDGKCGEIMVISEWLRENPGKSLPQNKVIVAVNNNGVVPPCDAHAGRGTYGCTQFLQQMHFTSAEIIEKEPEEEACELVPPGSPKGSLGKRACKRPSKGTKGKAPKKGSVSKPKGAKPAPRRQAARPASRRPKHRRSVQTRWN